MGKIKGIFSKIKKKHMIYFSVMLVVLLTGVFGFTKYSEYVATHYPKGAKVGDVLVEKMTIEEAQAKVKGRYDSEQNSIKVFQEKTPVAEIKIEKPYNIDTIFKEMDVSKTSQKVVRKEIDMDKVNKEISELKYKQELDKGKNAKLVRDGEVGFKIEKHVPSKIINKEKVNTAIHDTIKNNTFDKPIQVNDFIENTIKVKEDNKDLVNKVNNLNKLANKKVVLTLKKDDKVEVPQRNVALSVQEDGTVDSEYFTKWLNEVNQEHANYSETVEFHKTNGGTITYPNDGSYGWSMDTYSTSLSIAEQIKNNTEDNLLVKATTVGNTTESDKAVIDGDYVEIDLEAQHMWVYRNNKEIVSTPVITGNVTDGYVTPTGKYKVSYLESPSVLRGLNKDGTKYASPVNYWIPFNGDIGIHDSDWQASGSYGGSSYKTVGSKGCINTPPSVMKKVYENTYQGMTVIVHGNI